jgi:ubiquinone/menaquinone biosynthesis C-methylase UbiE
MTHIEEWMRRRYDESAHNYRHDDEVDVTGEDHQQIARRLLEICESFPYPIEALDIGCGTGRYFHALENVRKLVGLDVSEEMLERARNPVRAEELSAWQVELRCGNFYKYEFPEASFDLIYAIGVFGNGCPITPEISRKLFGWLKPGGRLFFDVLDSKNLPGVQRVRKQLRSSLYLALPPKLQKEWDIRTGWPPMFMISRIALARAMRRAGFESVRIERRFMRLPLGDAWKHQCLAIKSGGLGVRFA